MDFDLKKLEEMNCSWKEIFQEIKRQNQILLERLKIVQKISEEEANVLYNLAVFVDMDSLNIKKFLKSLLGKRPFNTYNFRYYRFNNFGKEFGEDDKKAYEISRKKVKYWSNSDIGYMLDFIEKRQCFILKSVGDFIVKSGNQELISCYAYDFPCYLSDEFLKCLVFLHLDEGIEEITSFYQDNKEKLKHIQEVLKEACLERDSTFKDEKLKKELKRK